jgi:hypothetical protein
MTDLAYRVNTGAALSPLWERRSNELRLDAGDEKAPRRKRTFRRDAYAAAHRNETFDRIAARGPLF